MKYRPRKTVKPIKPNSESASFSLLKDSKDRMYAGFSGFYPFYYFYYLLKNMWVVCFPAVNTPRKRQKTFSGTAFASSWKQLNNLLAKPLLMNRQPIE